LAALAKKSRHPVRRVSAQRQGNDGVSKGLKMSSPHCLTLAEAKERVKIPQLWHLFGFPGEPKKQCRCPFHEDGNPSFSVYDDGRKWKCHAGCGEGSAIDFIAKAKNLSDEQACLELIRLAGDDPNTQGQSSRAGDSEPRHKEIAAYNYQDQSGKVVFQVIRYEPKDFRQCRLREDGTRLWNMDGQERFPYHLPEILAAPPETEIWIVEGEKDVDRLREYGFIATCNPGGAGKWLPSFAQFFTERTIVICQDNDQPGANHACDVLRKIRSVTKSATIIRLPEQYKDLSELKNALEADFRESEFVPFLNNLVANAAKEQEPNDFNNQKWRWNNYKNPSGDGKANANDTNGEAKAAQPPPGEKRELSEILQSLGEFLRRFIVFTSEAQPIVIALWIAHTWVIAAFEHTPYLHISSPTKRCGKSRVFDCLKLLCAKAWEVISVTEARAKSLQPYNPLLMRVPGPF
jgi:CHC2-type zinc finger protein